MCGYVQMRLRLSSRYGTWSRLTATSCIRTSTLPLLSGAQTLVLTSRTLRLSRSKDPALTFEQQEKLFRTFFLRLGMYEKQLPRKLTVEGLDFDSEDGNVISLFPCVIGPKTHVACGQEDTNAQSLWHHIGPYMAADSFLRRNLAIRRRSSVHDSGCLTRWRRDVAVLLR